MTTQSGPRIQSFAPEGFYNLALGQPSPGLLPTGLIADAASKCLRKTTDPLLLQYGVRNGPPKFRETLACFLETAHQIKISPDYLMAGGSISLSLSLICGVFANRRKLVICEDPTYFLAKNIFTSSGAEVIGVPNDEGGLCLRSLTHLIEKEKKVPDFVYLIPNFHNPSSVSLAKDRYEPLFALAEKHDFFLVSDEPYNLLSFEDDVPKPLALFDKDRARVLSVSSFSKILGPGLRFGWIHAHPSLLERVINHGVLRSGGGLNPIIAEIVQQLIDEGSLSSHVSMLRNTFRLRNQSLVSALKQKIPAVKFETPKGGYFLWARLPDRLNASELFAKAKNYQVSFLPGSRCALSRNLDEYIRLSFAFYEKSELVEAVDRLALMIQGETT